MFNNIISIDELRKTIKQEREEFIKLVKVYLKKREINQTKLAKEINEDVKLVNKVLNLILNNKKVIVKILMYLNINLMDSISLLFKLGIGLSYFDVEERIWLELLSSSKKVDLETIRNL